MGLVAKRAYTFYEADGIYRNAVCGLPDICEAYVTDTGSVMVDVYFPNENGEIDRPPRRECAWSIAEAKESVNEICNNLRDYLTAEARDRLSAAIMRLSAT